MIISENCLTQSTHRGCSRKSKYLNTSFLVPKKKEKKSSF